MSKNLTITLIILITIPIIVFFFYKKDSTKFESIDLTIKNADYKLEVAKTLSQKSAGLSNRKSLCSNCGMIFVFSKNGIQPFWMKDTLIPLDMIWLNSDGQVTDIVNANETNSSKILQNTQPAKYVIELNLNETQKINLKIGDMIDLSKLND